MANLIAQQTRPPGIDSVVVIFENPPVVILQKAPLKYNKAFAMSFQMDDALSDIFEKVYPVFHGDGVTPGLTFTDGCGNPITFKMSSAIYIFSNNNNTDILDPDDPYHDAGKLTWSQLDILYRSRWGIENHGLFDNPDLSSSEKIEYAFQRTESYARRKISDSIAFKSFVIPNGDDIYASYLARNHYHAAINQGTDNSWIGFGNIGINVESDTINWLKPVKLNRLFLYGDFKKSADTLYAHSLHSVHEWLLSGMHTLPGNFIAEMKEIYDTYGKPGLDNILLAPDDEILDYLAVKQAAQLHQTLNGNRMTITFSGNIPVDRLFYALSLNVFANQTIDSIYVYGTEKYSYTGVGKDTALINLAWDGRYYYPTEMLADSFTNLAMTSGSEWKALVAMDYIKMLPSGETKIRLQDSLCSLNQSGWPIGYDAGFCNLVHLGNDTTLCPGDTLNLKGPGNMASYVWLRNGTVFSNLQNVMVSPDTATTYVLSVKDLSGNNMSDTLKAGIFPVPQIDLGADTGICAGSFLSFSAPAGDYSYRWNNGDTTASITVYPFSDTLVSLTVTTPQSCAASDSVLVFYHLPPVVSIPQDSNFYCFGDSVLLTANSKAPGLSYQWNTGDSTSSVAFSPGIPDTTYRFFVKVTSPAGCVAYDTAKIFVNPLVSVFTDYDTLKTCSGLSAVVSCTPVQGNFVSFFWHYNGDTIVTNNNRVTVTNPSASQWIHLSALDKTGCFAHDSTYLHVIPYPEIILPNDTVLCFGDSLRFSGSGGPLFYWLSGKDTLSKNTDLIISPETSAVYQAVTGYDAQCMAADSVVVTVQPSPIVKIVKDNTPVCVNTSLLLTATGADHYVWMPGNVKSDTFSIKPQDTLTVVLTGTSPEGCVATDSLTLSPAPLPNTHFTGLMPSYCENDPVITLAGEPEGGIFSGDGMNGNIFSPAEAGPGNHAIYYSYVSAAGCVGKSGKETYVFGPIPAIYLLPEDTTLQPGGFVSYDAGSGFGQYYWTTGATTREIKVKYGDFSIGTDTIHVVAIIGGCSATGEAVITFANPTGIIRTRVEPLNIFPNPAHESVSVSLPDAGRTFALELYDGTGKVVFSRRVMFPYEKKILTLDISNLKPGFYYLWLYNNSKSYLSKMVVR